MYHLVSLRLIITYRDCKTGVAVINVELSYTIIIRTMILKIKIITSLSTN